MDFHYDDNEAVSALVSVIGEAPWIAVDLARGLQVLQAGASLEDASRTVYETGGTSLRRCRQLLQQASDSGFLSVLERRLDTGSSVNPITKLFPATVTEQRFLEELDILTEGRGSTDYADNRESGHTLSDFTLREDDHDLPINIKNAGTRFEHAEQLVGLDPDDCIPIPAYKAHGAVERLPNLLYIISVDYTLIATLDELLPQLFARQETIVWDLLTHFKGTRIRKAEDAFIWKAVANHWDQIKTTVADTPFHVVSARKAIKILQDKPKRTPGIGLRAWGNRASAEVNVHLSIAEDTMPWTEVRERIEREGVVSVVEAVNRKRQAWIYDPEI